MRLSCLFFLITLVVSAACKDTQTEWRSTLYPENWIPGQQDTQGRFLHDFSYAGYHAGEDSLPELTPTIDVTQSPYNADNSGQQDATLAIQSAINAAIQSGGGVVYLPAGLYRVAPQNQKPYALLIQGSNVVLKGAGAGSTFIFNDSTEMREKDIIRVSPDAQTKWSWHWVPDTGNRLTTNAIEPAIKIKTENLHNLHVGDWVMLFADTTADWVAEHGMTGKWPPRAIGGVLFYRKITALNPATNELTIDSPIRYSLKVRDNARVVKVRPHLEEVGVEDLSIGMRQVPRNELDDNEYNVPGTTSYRIHQSHMITFNHVVNGWIRRVNSYRPSGNTDNVHILSNAIHLFMSKNITVDSCDMRHTLYKGAGGNGYNFTIQGNDNLIINSYAEDGRHNYDFTGLEASGNAVVKSTSKSARLPSDFHMYLSPANLFDSMKIDNDYISAIYRDTANPKHGHGSTQSVIWNTISLGGNDAYAVDTQQFGWGYVIGTSGKRPSIRTRSGNNTDPVDFVEGAGSGNKLIPQSLYLDQLSRRLGRN